MRPYATNVCGHHLCLAVTLVTHSLSRSGTLGLIFSTHRICTHKHRQALGSQRTSPQQHMACTKTLQQDFLKKSVVTKLDWCVTGVVKAVVMNRSTFRSRSRYFFISQELTLTGELAHHEMNISFFFLVFHIILYREVLYSMLKNCPEMKIRISCFTKNKCTTTKPRR